MLPTLKISETSIKDEKTMIMNEVLNSPKKAPPKKIEKIHTKVGDIRVENTPDSKKKLQMKLNLLDEEELLEVFCVRFDPDDSFLASSYVDGSIKIFNVNTGKISTILNGSLENTPTTTLRWRPRGVSSKTKNLLLSGNSDGNITHWHATSGKEIRRIVEENNQILSLDYNFDGSCFATGGKDLKIRIYDEETGVPTQILESVAWSSPGHSNRIFALKFLKDEDPNVLLSGGWDANVFFWDIREKTNFASIYGPSLSGDALDFKKNVILTGSHRNQEQLQLWDFKQREKIQDILWENDKKIDGVNVYGAQFCKNNEDSLFAGCGGKNEAKLFEFKGKVRTLSGVYGVKKGIYSVDYGNATNRVAFGGGDGVTYVFTISNL